VTAFELAAPARIVFRAGAAGDLGAVAGELGRRALLVTGRAPARADSAARGLEAAGVAVTRFPVEGEPTVEVARAGVAAGRAAVSDVVVGFGGGSALDAAKAIAALLANGGDPLDYLEVIGRGQPLTRPSLPFVAVPTTAGTGSEATKNAVLASPDHGLKASLRSAHMLPRVALIDPDLLIGIPAPVLAAGGLDALSQLIEPYVSIRANPFTDGLAREGIRRSAGVLRRAYDAARAGAPIAPEDREALALASLHGGLCLANAGLGAVHGFAAPVGGLYAAPHGAVCAALLPSVMRANVRALGARAPASPALGRYREIAALVTGDLDASVDDGMAWIADLCRTLEVPGLAHYGLTQAGIPALVAKARVASSMKGNPVALTDGELAEIARGAL
jgi:alcohol dehydrogenase class IV